jgi:hypothetical protein
MTAAHPRPTWQDVLAGAAEYAIVRGDALASLRALIERLVTVLDDRMTKAGHPYALVLQEHRGTCPPYECSARCIEYRALFVEAMAWLDANASEALLAREDRPLLAAVQEAAPEQVEMFEGVS